LSKVQIDNTYFEIKVFLRESFIPSKKNLKVLDLFCGKNKIWDKIKKNYKGNIIILGIDKEEKSFSLRGDNLKFIDSLDLDFFDVIDLDAYGIPFKQLDKIFKKNLKNKHIFVTFIQNGYGILNKKMLNELGYSNNMIEKIPTLFNKKGFEKFKNYLSKKGIKNIKYINIKNKYYIYFKINPE